MATQRGAGSPLLGFLVFEKTSKKDGFICALMVTDNRGYPLEFRATTPVRPSLVQRTLYGSQLEHYLGVELCGRPLVEQSQRKPNVIVVPERWLLDIAEEAHANFVAIRRAGETLRVQEDEISATTGALKSASSAHQPAVYEGRFVSADQEKDVIAFLEDCHSRFDLVEVFERIRAALDLLAKEDSRYA